MFKNIFESLKRRATFISTQRELSKLSDKELHDIGISRYMIHEIAYNNAYGAMS